MHHRHLRTDSPTDRERAQSLLQASTTTPYRFTVGGVRHFNFTDYGAFYLALPIRKVIALGGIDGDHALTIQNAYVTAFFDHALRHAPHRCSPEWRTTTPRHAGSAARRPGDAGEGGQGPARVGAEATTDQPGLLAARAARGHPSTLTPSRMGSLSLSA
jgi:hypothetical protein